MNNDLLIATKIKSEVLFFDEGNRSLVNKAKILLNFFSVEQVSLVTLDPVSTPYFYEKYGGYKDELLSNPLFIELTSLEILTQDYDSSLPDNQNLWKVMFKQQATFYELLRMFLLVFDEPYYYALDEFWRYKRGCNRSIVNQEEKLFLDDFISNQDAFDWFYIFVVEEQFPPLTRMKVNGCGKEISYEIIVRFMYYFGTPIIDRIVQGYHNLDKFPNAIIVTDDRDVPLPTIILGNISAGFPNPLSFRNYLIERKQLQS